MKQQMDDMKNKMLEMEKKVKKLELKVCGFPDAIEVSSEGRAAEDWSTHVGKYDLEAVIHTTFPDTTMLIRLSSYDP